MSLSRPCSRLRQPVATLNNPFRPPPPPFRMSCRSYADQRGAASIGGNKSNAPPAEHDRRGLSRQRKPAGKATPGDFTKQQGALAKSSIFNQVLGPSGASSRKVSRFTTTEKQGPSVSKRDPTSMAARLDPSPRLRMQFERKKVIQGIRKGGALTKEQFLKRTERHLVFASEFWRTSMKKLNLLARQIAGKTLSSATEQMMFSAKKPARFILEHLQEAKNRAIVERGMNLGQATGTEGPRTTIKLKDKTKHTIEDRTDIFIEQAWVSKGPYGFDTQKRARGRMDKLLLPQTGLTVVLKEEVTRIREHEEREKKEANKKLWEQLPNRPVSAQRPYYCW